MKKLIGFLMFLALGIFFFIPIKVSAITPDGTATDWYNFITQFENGYASATVEFIEEWENDELFAVIINESPGNEFDGYYLQYDTSENEHAIYFDVLLSLGISVWMAYGRTQGHTLKEEIEGIALEEGIIIDFDGTIYWNFEEEYWQIEPYGDEPDYQEGYQEGYQDGYQDGFIAGEKSKLAKNNESFYNNIAIWIPAVITLVALASIISFFGIKKKE